MNKLITSVILACFSLCFSVFATAQTGPRLFTTPELRTELERRRYGYVSPEPESAAIELFSELLAADESEEIVYSLEGVLLQDDGQSIVWLNGKAVAESQLPGNIQVARPYSKGQLKIVSASKQEYQLMPGQVLNLSTGTLYESYQWQEILTQRRLQELAAAVSAGDSVEAQVIEE